jgi:hypothetical protein
MQSLRWLLQAVPVAQVAREHVYHLHHLPMIHDCHDDGGVRYMASLLQRRIPIFVGLDYCLQFHERQSAHVKKSKKYKKMYPRPYLQKYVGKTYTWSSVNGIFIFILQHKAAWADACL